MAALLLLFERTNTSRAHAPIGSTDHLREMSLWRDFRWNRPPVTRSAPLAGFGAGPSLWVGRIRGAELTDRTRLARPYHLEGVEAQKSRYGRGSPRPTGNLGEFWPNLQRRFGRSRYDLGEFSYEYRSRLYLPSVT